MKAARVEEAPSVASQALQYSALYLATLRSIDVQYANTMINGSHLDLLVFARNLRDLCLDRLLP